MAFPLAIPAGKALIAGGAWAWRGYRAYRLARAAEAARRLEQAARTASQLSQQDPNEPCPDCDEVDCFKKPDGMSEEEFARQLKEQQDAINNTTADQLVARRDAIRAAGGTGPLRDRVAQEAAREAYQTKRMTELLETMSRSRAEAALAKEMSGLAATHRLDIIAGGDPSDISGMGNRSVNSSLGAQWRGARSQQLEDAARRMQSQGRGNEKMNVKLKKCP